MSDPELVDRRGRGHLFSQLHRAVGRLALPAVHQQEFLDLIKMAVGELAHDVCYSIELMHYFESEGWVRDEDRQMLGRIKAQIDSMDSYGELWTEDGLAADRRWDDMREVARLFLFDLETHDSGLGRGGVAGDVEESDPAGRGHLFSQFHRAIGRLALPAVYQREFLDRAECAADALARDVAKGMGHLPLFVEEDWLAEEDLHVLGKLEALLSSMLEGDALSRDTLGTDDRWWAARELARAFLYRVDYAVVHVKPTWWSGAISRIRELMRGRRSRRAPAGDYLARGPLLARLHKAVGRLALGAPAQERFLRYTEMAVDELAIDVHEGILLIPAFKEEGWLSAKELTALSALDDHLESMALAGDDTLWDLPALYEDKRWEAARRYAEDFLFADYVVERE